MKPIACFLLLLLLAGCTVISPDESKVVGALQQRDGCVFITGSGIPIPGGTIAIAKGPKARCSSEGASIGE